MVLNCYRLLPIVVLLLAFWPNNLSAQRLSVELFEQRVNDISASTASRVDNNGVPCALMKVQLAARGAEFEGMIVGDIDYKTSEYWVYMPKGSKRIKLKLEGYLPLEVEFSQFGINALESKVTYLLVITGVVTPVQNAVMVKETAGPIGIINESRQSTVKDTIYLPENKTSQRKGELTIMATAMPTRSIIDGMKQTAWGITIGKGNTWGWYANATSNFDFVRSAGTVSGTDGTTDGGDLIFFNDVRSVSLHQATGGVSYRISNHLKVILGAGYGLRNVYAQSEKGKYYQIGGGGGVCLEAGICLSVSILSFEASVCSPALSGISTRVGLGIKL